MNRIRVALALIAVLGFGACNDSSPTANEPTANEAALELLAESALEVNDQQGTPLPSLDNLLRRTYKAIREEDGHGRGVQLLRAGQTLHGIIAVLGTEVAGEALSGVDQALAQLDVRFAGKTLPDRMQKALERATTFANRGHEALDSERYAAALGAALASADHIRSLSPRFQARKAIDRATRAYQAARAAVGDNPTEDEKTALKKASRFRNGAIDAFKNKAFRKAWTYAKRSIALSQEVLKGRSGG